MTEVSFAKSFLASLDSKPQKLTADHVEDPRSYPARAPYTLPRHSKPMSRRTRLAPGAERSVSVTVRSLRGRPAVDIRLAALPPSTSVLEVRAAVAERAGVPPERVRLLHAKKPVPDTRVLKDLVGEEGAETSSVVEFSVMVMGGGGGGGAAAAGGAGDVAVGTAAGPGPAGTAVLETEEFWGDLKGFLQQRLRDESAAEEALGMFRGAWQGRS